MRKERLKDLPGRAKEEWGREAKSEMSSGRLVMTSLEKQAGREE